MKVKKIQWQWRVSLTATLLLVLFSLSSMAGAPVPDIPEAIKGTQCVEDTDFMRRNHMEILLHQRDDTLRRGIRTKKHSLKNCFTCHVVKDADNKPVTAKNPKHFCRECHDYAAVKVDCFECHSSVPGGHKATGTKI